MAGQSFVLVSALEALAAQGRARPATVILGAAHTVRESAIAHMRPLQALDDGLRQSLERDLGTAAFDEAHSEGKRLTPAQALRC